MWVLVVVWFAFASAVVIRPNKHWNEPLVSQSLWNKSTRPTRQRFCGGVISRCLVRSQGMKVLGTLVGRSQFVQAQLRPVTDSHRDLFGFRTFPIFRLYGFCCGIAMGVEQTFCFVQFSLAPQRSTLLEHDGAMRRCLNGLLGSDVPHESPVLHWEVGITEQFPSPAAKSAGGPLSPQCTCASPCSRWAGRCSVATGRAKPACASSRELQGTVVVRGSGSAPWEELVQGALPTTDDLDEAHGWRFLVKRVVEDCFFSVLRWHHGRVATHLLSHSGALSL